MEQSEELKKIKKIYGEKFMHLCRTLFPTLLETEGKLLEILSNSFADNGRTLYEDISNNNLEVEFKDYIYSQVDMESSEKEVVRKGAPYQLLDEAGYKLFECKNEAEIQSFKKYYAPNEELCTFEGGRLDRCVVFFAVRKDVDEIKREDYMFPKREDRYGTSVMGIQFNKEGLCTVSIKNRYNHRVNNPDATYGNDLNKIIPGLTQSFSELLEKRGLYLNSKNLEGFYMPNYIVASDGKYYKYNKEINGIYYCPGNVVIENGTPRKLKDNELLVDAFVFDTKEKTVKLYDENIKDSFVDAFIDMGKMEVVKNKEKGDGARTIVLYKNGSDEPIKVEIDKDNEITGYVNKDVEKIGDGFLTNNVKLSELDLPSLKVIGNDFCYTNIAMKKLRISQLEEIGDGFFSYNKSINELELPEVRRVGHGFLNDNNELKKVKFSQLEEIGDSFLCENRELIDIELPQLRKTGGHFLAENIGLKRLYAPKLGKMGDFCLARNKVLDHIDIPQIEEFGIGSFGSHKQCNKLMLKQKMNVAKSKLTHRDLAKMDKDNEMTNKEISIAARLIGRIKSISKNLIHNNDDRDTR